ncbi:MAG: DUF4293 domain-containing protein [Bacteroides sp.]|nr:DUF4293 domain-containing protein [Bacteroides sp.]
MQIQRIQTLFLLLAIACVAAFLFVPFGYWSVAEAHAGNIELVDLVGKNYASLILPSVVALVLMVIAVFSFKKMPFQKLMVVLSALATVAAAGVVIYIMTRGFVGESPEFEVKAVWSGGGMLLIAALIAQISAYRNITRDQNLLRSYDRLR